MNVTPLQTNLETNRPSILTYQVSTGSLGHHIESIWGPTRCTGLFPKISTTRLRTTLNWVLKNFRISNNDSNSFCRIPNLAGSKSWGIQEFCNALTGFRGIPVKIHKIWRKFKDFQSCSLSIFYRISYVVHGGVWIFSAHYVFKGSMNTRSKAK